MSPTEVSLAQTRTRAVVIAGTMLAVVACHLVARGSSWRSSESAHIAVELMTALLAVIIAALAMMRFYARRSLPWLLAGVAFAGTALLDGAHMVFASTQGELSGLQVDPLVPWSWLAGRTFLPAVLTMRALTWNHPDPRRESVVFAAAGMGVLALLGVMLLAPLPAPYRPDALVSRPQEWLAATLFVFAFASHLRLGAWKTSGFEMYLVVSLLLGLGAQALLMPFSHVAYDAMFNAAHLAKIVSMLVVLLGLLVATFRLYRDAEREHQERTFGFLENIPVGVFILNTRGEPYYANAEATRLLGQGAQPGVPAGELAPTYHVFVAGTDEPYPSERLPIVRALAGERSSVSDVEVRHDDDRVQLQIHGAPIYGPDKKVAFAVAAFQDVRELRRAALQDRLTGLANRVAFEGTFGHLAALAERSEQPLCLAMLDLDRFKGVNDTYGHEVGDEVLRRAAHVVSSNLRRADVLARWGGEEFVALLPHTVEAEAASVIERALIALRQEVFAADGGRTFRVTFSAGLVRVASGMSAHDAIVLADKALYRAKESGRDRICLA